MFKLQREILSEVESLFYGTRLLLKELRHDMHNTKTNIVLLDAIIKRSLSAGMFRGRYDKTVYVPHSYRDGQLDLIKSLVAAGGYIGKCDPCPCYGYQQ